MEIQVGCSTAGLGVEPGEIIANMPRTGCSVFELILFHDWREPGVYEDVASAFSHVKLLINSIHADRYLGSLIGAKDAAEAESGIELLQRSVNVADVLGARVVVAHVWDTFEAVDINLDNIALRLADAFAGDLGQAGISIENVPTCCGLDQADIWERFTDLLPDVFGFTLDLYWAHVFGNLPRLLKFIDRVNNIHIGLTMEGHGDCLSIRVGDGLESVESLVKQVRDSGYNGTMVIEPRGGLKSVDDYHYAADCLRRYIS
jgi:sugar phosphate isomerase/epimerase